MLVLLKCPRDKGNALSTVSKREEIAEVFKNLVAASPANKRVTVVDITNALNIDRKTFYNYFENIDNVAIWIYRDHLRKMLQDPKFDGCEFVKPDSSLYDQYSDWPFYVRIKRNDRFLAQEMFYETMAHHFVGNRPYYSKVFQPDSALPVYDYIINLFLPAIKDDVLYLLDGRAMPEVAINFLAEYHVMGIFGRLRYHFTCSGWNIMQEDITPFWNYSHITLKNSIESLFAEECVPSGHGPKAPLIRRWKYRASLQ